MKYNLNQLILACHWNLLRFYTSKCSGLMKKPTITGFKWIYSSILSTFPDHLSPMVYYAAGPENFRDQSELFPFFFPALSIIQILHSFLLSDTLLIAAYNSKEVCFFISPQYLLICFTTPIIMWTLTWHYTPSINLNIFLFLESR